MLVGVTKKKYINILVTFVTCNIILTEEEKPMKIASGFRCLKRNRISSLRTGPSMKVDGVIMNRELAQKNSKQNINTMQA